MIPTRQALDKAKQLGLDLVETAPNADPPVCRICDYGKYKYDMSKKKGESPKHRVKTKELKFRVGTSENDYRIKLSHAEEFLSNGDKLRLQLQFRGRENAHRELGFVKLQQVKADLAGMAKCDIEPKLSGRQVVMMMSPLPPDQQQRKYTVEELEEDPDAELTQEEFDAEHAEDGDAEHAEAETASDEEE